MPATLRVTNRGAVGHVKLVGDEVARQTLVAAREWLEVDVIPRIKRRNYAFTDRTYTLRPSIRTITDQQARDARGRFVAGGYAAIVSDVFYAPYVEFNYGGAYSYARRAQAELLRRLDSRIATRLARYTRSVRR